MMRKNIIKNASFLLVILVGFLSCAEKASLDVNITITGKVVDSETGEPIQGCEVQLNSEQFVLTTSSGTFSIENGDGKGEYTLTFSATDYQTINETKSVSNQSELDFGTIELKPSVVTLTGKIVNKETNEAIEDCEVRLSDELFVRTKNDGTFTINEATANSSYELTIVAEGYVQKTETREAKDQTILDFGIIKLEPALITLSGEVIDNTTGAPIKGVRVQLGTEMFVSTNSSGEFTLHSENQQQNYTLKFYGNGYAVKIETRQASAQTNINFGTIQLGSTNDLAALKTITINGKDAYVLPADIGGEMTYTQAQSSIQYLTAYGYSDWQLPSKDELNQIYLKKDEIGGFYDDYYWSNGNSDVQSFSDGEQNNLSSSSKARCRAIMYIPDEYSFTIVDEDNQPMNGVEVIIKSYSSSSSNYLELVSNSDGVVTFYGNDIDDYYVKVLIDDILMTSGDCKEMNGVVIKTKNYEFTILDEENNPIKGADISVYDNDNKLILTISSPSSGEVSFIGYDFDDYIVTTSKVEYTSTSSPCYELDNSQIILTSAVSTITDYDGNIYKTIQIGTQWWMAENLRSTTYADGRKLNYIDANDDGDVNWQNVTSIQNKQFRYYGYNLGNAEPYGALYNWLAAVDYGVNQPQGICPNGWHVPSYSDWSKLSNYVKSNISTDVSKALASKDEWIRSLGDKGDIGYDAYKNNSTGFNALPSGTYRYRSDYFGSMGSQCYWWTSEGNEDDGVEIALYYNDSWRGISGGSYSGDENTENGYSIRCVKD